MELLKAIIDAAAGFVRRNPLLCLLILFLAVAAPAVLKGIAVFILYFVLGVMALVALGGFLLQWRLRRMRREMEERFGTRSGGEGASGDVFGASARHGSRRAAEGEVRVYRTADTPVPKVADDVGDYVEFEETKDSGKR